MKPTMQIRTRTTQGGELQRFARFLLLCFILTLTGCDSDANSDANTGSGTLAVTLSATGEDLPFSLEARVAGTQQREEFGATLTFSNLTSGDHEVLLVNINANCQVQGENPHTVTILDGGTAQTHFELSCVQAPRVGRIVFSSGATGQENVYVMNEDGTRVIRLTNNPESVLGHDRGGSSGVPRWSPDGRSIAYTESVAMIQADHWISVMTPSGVGQKKLGNIGDTPRWSLDGQRLAFAPYIPADNAVSGLYVINADGSGLVHLTQNTPRGAYDWSPEGEHIAVTIPSNVQGGTGEIYIYNRDGSGGRKLTDGGGPRWSPAGQQIVFKTGSRLSVINANGTGLFRLNTPLLVQCCDHPTWSPDGARIAFRARDGLYVINADGMNLVKLVEPPLPSVDPTWSPDGTRILFEQGNDLHVINADGTGDPVNLTNDQRPVGHWGCHCGHWQMVPDIRR